MEDALYSCRSVVQVVGHASCRWRLHRPQPGTQLTMHRHRNSSNAEGLCGPTSCKLGTGPRKRAAAHLAGLARKAEPIDRAAPIGHAAPTVHPEPIDQPSHRCPAAEAAEAAEAAALARMQRVPRPLAGCGRTRP